MSLALLPRFDLDFDLKKLLRSGAASSESEEDDEDPRPHHDHDSSNHQAILDKAAPALANLDMLHLVRRLGTCLPRTHKENLSRIIEKSIASGNQICNHTLPLGIAKNQAWLDSCCTKKDANQSRKW